MPAITDRNDNEEGWYAVSCIWRAIRDDAPAPDDLCEEIILLVHARDPNEAATQACTLSERERMQYTAADGHQVSWAPLCVLGVHEIEKGELKSGAELFCRFMRLSEVESLQKRFEE